jgi:hypothetical protein
VQEAKQIGLVEFLTRASVLLGLMSSFCYAFGVGYIFYVEPRFLAAFSVPDLIFLFASSTSYLIFLLITFVPSLGLLAAGRQARGLFSGAGQIPREESNGRGPRWAADGPLRLIGVAIPAAITVTFAFLAVQDALDETPFLFFTMPDFMTAAGIAVIAATLSRYPYWALVTPVILFVYLLACFYVFGAMIAHRDLLDRADDRALPCAFIDSRAECFDLLAIGSDVALMRSRGRVVLIPRDRVRSVQTRKPIV